jgi:hypothetical protein
VTERVISRSRVSAGIATPQIVVSASGSSGRIGATGFNRIGSRSTASV